MSPADEQIYIIFAFAYMHSFLYFTPYAGFEPAEICMQGVTFNCS